LAYYEVYNKQEAKEVCQHIYDTPPPYRIQQERILPKAELDANKFFNGPVVRAFMKHTGYDHATAKGWLAIYHACVKEEELENIEDIEELFEMYNVYLYQKGALFLLNERHYADMYKDYSGTVYVTQKTSKMNIKRRNEFVDDCIDWLKDQDIKLAKNPNYKDELEF
jgi:hypothetical protein